MKTLYDKIWDAHIVYEEPGKPALLYIDLHLIHEVTSPQAFEGLRIAGRKVRRPELTFATVDHAIPTINRNLPFNDPIAAKQVETLRINCRSSACGFSILTASNKASFMYLALNRGSRGRG
jgi:3-isopropylmalate dehydratase large subunit